jgi:hypothetical protein
MENNSSLVINGICIDPGVLRKGAIRRCGDIKCMGACCSDGVWLCEDEPPRILSWAAAIKACLPSERHDESKWFEQGKKEMGTVSVADPMRPGDTCCVFLQPDRKCSLQVVSQAHNLGWPGIKPFYCAIYPLYTENDTLLVDNITQKNITGAMCRHASPPREVIYELFSLETTLVLGENGYKELCEKAKAKALAKRSSKKAKA